MENFGVQDNEDMEEEDEDAYDKNKQKWLQSSQIHDGWRHAD